MLRFLAGYQRVLDHALSGGHWHGSDRHQAKERSDGIPFGPIMVPGCNDHCSCRQSFVDVVHDKDLSITSIINKNAVAQWLGHHSYKVVIEGPSPPCATIDDHSMNRRSKEDSMSIFNNGTGKYLEDMFTRGISSIKEFFNTGQNAVHGEMEGLKRAQDDEDSVKGDEESHGGFLSGLFDLIAGGTHDDSRDYPEHDSNDGSSNYGGRDPGQDMQDAYDQQERDNRQREDYERQSRNDDER